MSSFKKEVDQLIEISKSWISWRGLFGRRRDFPQLSGVKITTKSANLPSSSNFLSNDLSVDQELERKE